MSTMPKNFAGLFITAQKMQLHALSVQTFMTTRQTQHSQTLFEIAQLEVRIRESEDFNQKILGMDIEGPTSGRSRLSYSELSSDEKEKVRNKQEASKRAWMEHMDGLSEQLEKLRERAAQLVAEMVDVQHNLALQVQGDFEELDGFSFVHMNVRS